MLIVSHDLGASGAPKIVHEMARILVAAGHDVTVGAPFDGPFRSQLLQVGASVVLCRGILYDAVLLKAMARPADAVICNTVVTHEAVRLVSPIVATYWYVHEVSLLREMLRTQPALPVAFAAAAGVWAGSELAAALIRPYRPSVETFAYGLDPVSGPAPKFGKSLNVVLFGSFESRKGQDLALAAVAALPDAARADFRLRMFGRVLDEAFYVKLLQQATAVPEVEIGGELGYDAYQEAMLAADAVIVPSRDDTLPLVSIDALSSGRLLLCTRSTGTAAFIEHGISGFIADSPDAEAITAMLQQVIERRPVLPKIAAEGISVFNRNFSRDVFAAELARRVQRLKTSDAAMR